MNINKIGLVILGITVWVIPAIMAFMFKNADILAAWILSYFVTDEIINAFKK